LGESRQYSLVSYGKDLDSKYIGDFAPVIVMHETKQAEVKELNQAVQKRFREAVRLMGKPLN